MAMFRLQDTVTKKQRDLYNIATKQYCVLLDATLEIVEVRNSSALLEYALLNNSIVVLTCIDKPLVQVAYNAYVVAHIELIDGETSLVHWKKE